MAEFNESEAKRDVESCIEKEGGNFSFGDRGHAIFDDLGNDCDGAVDEQTVGVAKEDEAARAALCFAGDKVGSIAVKRKIVSLAVYILLGFGVGNPIFPRATMKPGLVLYQESNQLPQI